MEPTTPNPPRVIPVSAEAELRPVRPEDAEALYALVELNRHRLRQWLPWLDVNYSLVDMRRHLVDRKRDNQNRNSFTATIWASGTICGAIGLHRIDQFHRNSSIGYWLAADFEGHGIMTQACRAMVSEAFANYGLHRIEIRCATGNRRSMAIPRRLGFREEGVLREAEWLYDHWVDLRVFSMLRQDWVDLRTMA